MSALTPSHWLSSLLVRGTGYDTDDPEKPGKASLVIASTSAVDRQDDIVEQDWELDDYAKNPVILWGHRYDLSPVGRALGVKVENGRLMASIEWDEDSEMGKQVARQVRDGFLNAVSVGFYPGQSIPRRSLPEGDPRKKDGYGYIHSKNRLLEISVVPVPANAEALFVTRSAGLADAATIRACLAKGLPIPGRDGEVMEVLLAEVRREIGASGIGALLERVGALEKALEAIRTTKAGALAVGDRVKVVGTPHADEHKTGVVKEIGSAAIGVQFDGTDTVHRWYVAEELERVEEDEGHGKAADPWKAWGFAKGAEPTDWAGWFEG